MKNYRLIKRQHKYGVLLWVLERQQKLYQRLEDA